MTTRRLLGAQALRLVCCAGSIFVTWSCGTEPSTPRPPAKLVVIEGDGQAGVVGQPLPVPIRVRVLDADGRPLVRIDVAFEPIIAKYGSFDPSAAKTDSTGEAKAIWTLGPAPGSPANWASISVVGLPADTIVASARAGAPARLTQYGGPLVGGLAGQPTGPIMRVNDAMGNSLPGVEVKFSVLQGQGMLADTIETTDENGDALAEWWLGVVPGANRLVAVVAASPDGTQPQLSDTVSVVSNAPWSATMLTLAYLSSCAISGVQTACWGANDAGQAGYGTYGPELGAGRARLVAGTFSEIAAGGEATCGLDLLGRVWCWGFNGSGMLGVATTATYVVTPTLVTGDARFAHIAVGADQVCGLTADGSAWCWGNGQFGALGTGDTLLHQSPTLVVGGHTFLSIAAASNTTCAVAVDSTGYCWGLGWFGEATWDGATRRSVAPFPIPGNMHFRQISVGESEDCGVLGDGRAYCWGANQSGGVGDGTELQRVSPTAVLGNLHFETISSAGEHTCGVTPDGTAYCWGRNDFGQLGDGTTTNRNVPTRVAGGARWRAIETGFFHTCAISSDSFLYCWGQRTKGQLGIDYYDGSIGTPLAITTPYGVWPPNQ